MTAPLLLVHVTPASYRDLPPRLSADELATMSISATVAIDLLAESLTTLVEEAALRCPHLRADGIAASVIQTIDHMLSDLSGDVGGALSNAAETERDELYHGCPRGVMHRVRP